MDRGTAYRRGLCVTCQRVKPAAGMTRCLPCLSDATGYRLTPAQTRQHLIYRMTGPHPGLALRALAIAIADIVIPKGPVTR